MPKRSSKRVKHIYAAHITALFVGIILSMLLMLQFSSSQAQAVPKFAGLRDIEVVWQTAPVSPDNVSQEADCPTGKIAISGGGTSQAGGSIQNSKPVGSAISDGGNSGSTTTPATGWIVSWTNSPAVGSLTAFVVCAAP